MEDQAARERRLRRERARPPYSIVVGGPGGALPPPGRMPAVVLAIAERMATDIKGESVVFAFKARSEAVRRFGLPPRVPAAWAVPVAGVPEADPNRGAQRGTAGQGEPEALQRPPLKLQAKAAFQRPPTGGPAVVAPVPVEVAAPAAQAPGEAAVAAPVPEPP